MVEKVLVGSMTWYLAMGLDVSSSAKVATTAMSSRNCAVYNVAELSLDDQSLLGNNTMTYQEMVYREADVDVNTSVENWDVGMLELFSVWGACIRRVKSRHGATVRGRSKRCGCLHLEE
jgi:hypothetical protein